MDTKYTTKLDEEIDILDIAKNILNYKYFIFILTSIFAVVSVFVALTLPVTYKSTVVLIESEPAATPKIGGVASLVGLDLGGAGSNKTAIALQVLKSRKFFIDFDNKRNAIPLMLASKWNKKEDTLSWPEGYDQNTQKWTNGSAPSQNYIYDNVYRKLLGVREDPITNIIEISYIHSSPKVSKQIVDWLIIDLNEQLKNDDLYEAEKSLDYLYIELEQAKSLEVRELISSMIKNKLQLKTIANSRKDYRFKVLDPAIAPELKFRPVRSVVCIVITVIGFFISLLMTLIYHYVVKPKKQ